MTITKTKTKNNLQMITQIIIDKAKNYATFKANHQQKEKVKKIKSDHNVIMLKISRYQTKDTKNICIQYYKKK